MLHNRRKRLAEIAEREANGESFWTVEFDSTIRTKLHHLIDHFDSYDYSVRSTSRKAILFEEGMFYLASANFQEIHDFMQYLATCPDEMMPTVIEAWTQALDEASRTGGSPFWGQGDKCREAINVLLREHRISFELVGREMIPFSSKEMHVEVVAPTLRLLASDPKWTLVENAYASALHEISAGDAADAITDAGTALQEALTSLGCDGNALGPLISSARKKGLFGAHDGPLLEAIRKTADWVSADRSENGDAHSAASADIDDAWLIVHVVGAFLIRVSKERGRG